MPFFGPPNLDKMIEKKDVKGLVKLLQTSADPVQRQQAVAGLLKIGDRRACEPLFQAKEDNDANVRALAAIALAYLGDPRAAERLIATMNTGGEASIRLLGMLGAKEALGSLMYMLQAPHSSSPKTLAAAEVLASLGDHRAAPAIVEELYRADEANKPRMIKALTVFGEAAIPPLMAKLKQGSSITEKWSSIRKDLEGAFLALGVPARIALTDALAEPAHDELFKDYVLLLRKMEDGLNSYRASAAHAIVNKDWVQVTDLGLLADDVLLGRLRSDSGEKVELVKALVHATGRDADKVLLDILHDPTLEPAHLAAIEVLASLDKIDDDRAILFLMNLLEHKFSFFQEKAARLLGRFTAPQVKQAMESLLDFSVLDSVRKTAVENFCTWDCKPTSDQALAVYYLTRGEWEQFKGLDNTVKEKVLGDLLANLNTYPADRKIEVIRILGIMDYKRAVESFIALLKDWDADVRMMVCTALGWLGDASAIPALERVARFDSYSPDSDTITNVYKYDHTGGSNDYWSSSEDVNYPVRDAASSALRVLTGANKKRETIS